MSSSGGGDNSVDPLRHRPINPHEYTRMEYQVQTHIMRQKREAMQNPFLHPLEEQSPLQQSLPDEDQFYSININQSDSSDQSSLTQLDSLSLTPLGHPPLSWRSNRARSDSKSSTLTVTAEYQRQDSQNVRSNPTI